MGGSTFIFFTIPGAPKGKARARTLKNGHSYTPSETVNYENWVKFCFSEQQLDGLIPTDGPVALQMTAAFPIPKSTSKKQRERMLAGNVVPTKKPDCDNLLKIVADALNGIAYRDDSQIVKCDVAKVYSDTPEVRVRLELMKGGA